MIQLPKLIERWSNAHRVLVAMPQHDREKHWDMATWGIETECGTVACAAGHCGLDTWFRRRGFKLDFKDGESKISDVPGFFGLEGASRIFHNTKRRKVEVVIKEVETYISELEQMAALMAKAKAPAIGKEWPEQGGICAGVRLGHDGKPSYFLVVGPESELSLNWDAAKKWATGISVNGHSDFELPNREEQMALFDRVRELFQPAFYWSSLQHASDSFGAWGQYFSYGCQDAWFKGFHGRARAVRRVFA